MKHWIITGIAVISCFTISLAQSGDDNKINLSDLEIPTSPAFMLLDVGASTMEQPGSAKAFALGIVNAVSENSGFPQNYAVEFTPFWFFKHPNMTSLKYSGFDVEKDKQMIFSNITKGALSMALIQSSDSITSFQNVSFGFRTNLITVRRKADIEALKHANLILVSQLRDQQQRLVSYIGDVMLRITDPALYEQKVREFYAREEENHADEKNQIAEVMARRPLFAVDAAAALNLAFHDQDFSSGSIGRSGAWLTANYAQPLKTKDKNQENYLNIYFLMRYLNDQNFYGSSNDYFDAGGKAELEFGRISFGYEYVFRDTGGSSTFRSSGEVRYRISPALYLSGAFGRNFGDDNNLIALLGINWGLNTGNESVLPE